MTLMTGNAPGNDMRFYWERVEASRNFANKIWNASRFIMMNMPDEKLPKISLEKLCMSDKWILSKCNKLVSEVTENLDKFELGVALSKIYDFIWEEFCDWYIEMVKPRLWNKDDTTREAALYTLNTVLINSLKLLHPYMPFITEEIFCNLSDEESIMISSWPKFDKALDMVDDERAVEIVKEAVRSIRNVRTSMNVPPSKKAAMHVVSADSSIRDIFEHNKDFFAMLAGASEVYIEANKDNIESDAVSAVIPEATVYIPLAELVDIAKEIERLSKEEARLEGELKRSAAMLSNEKFISKAPKEKIDEEKQKQQRYEQMMANIKSQLEHLKSK